MFYWTIVAVFICFLLVADIGKAAKSYIKTGYPKSPIFNTAAIIYGLLYLASAEEAEDDD
jgi:hypothetical protein